MLRRSLDATFMPGAYVFPGGAVDADDASQDAQACCDEPQQGERLGAWGGAHAVAALRECFEECGLWLGAGPSDPAALHAARARLRGRECGIDALSRALGLPLATSALWPFAHWVTPIDVAKRFDTRFFVALAPDDQAPAADATETTSVCWVEPRDALARFERGEFQIEFATRENLRALAAFAGVQALLDHALTPRAIQTVHPRVAVGAGGKRSVLVATDHAYAEVSRLDPSGTGRALATIEPGRVVQLGPALRRLTAPNAGMMTGPGTNSYLLGAPGGEQIVIDPGPAIDAHVDALLEASSGRIAAILVTHTHQDHSPAAARLAAMTGAIRIGLPAPANGRQDRTFTPDERPADGEPLALAGIALRAIHTPGHASNHVCWWYGDERLLFTGDHLMQGSTVVIDPPDGDMAAYLASLRGLADRLPSLAWLAPGHGFLIGEPLRAIERLVAHRLGREAKVLAALERLGGGDVAALLPAVYDDVAPQLHPVAARSLLAHLLKLQHEGRAAEHGGRWQLR